MKTWLRALALMLVLVACEPTDEQVTPDGSEVSSPPALSRPSPEGRVSCRDGTGDLLSEGFGRRDERGSPPEKDQPGADLTGFSMGRLSSGVLEINFATRGRIPESWPRGSQLHLSVTATPIRGRTRVAAVTATLKGERWMVHARNDDDDSEIGVQPEIAGKVMNLVVDPNFVPRLMRGTFKWRASSAVWTRQPGDRPTEVHSDYCPDNGSRVFRATAG